MPLKGTGYLRIPRIQSWLCALFVLVTGCGNAKVSDVTVCQKDGTNQVCLPDTLSAQKGEISAKITFTSVYLPAKVKVIWLHYPSGVDKPRPGSSEADAPLRLGERMYDISRSVPTLQTAIGRPLRGWSAGNYTIVVKQEQTEIKRQEFTVALE